MQTTPTHVRTALKRHHAASASLRPLMRTAADAGNARMAADCAQRIVEHERAIDALLSEHAPHALS